MVEQITLKKEARPVCPLCNTAMIPNDDIVLDDSGQRTRVWICNCNPNDHNLIVEL